MAILHGTHVSTHKNDTGRRGTLSVSVSQHSTCVTNNDGRERERPIPIGSVRVREEHVRDEHAQHAEENNPFWVDATSKRPGKGHTERHNTARDPEETVNPPPWMMERDKLTCGERRLDCSTRKHPAKESCLRRTWW